MYEKLADTFIKSTEKIFEEMTKIKIASIGKTVVNGNNGLSFGITSIVTFNGLIKGRFVFDAQPALIMKMMEIILEDISVSPEEKPSIGGIAELNNIITGDAITVINDTYKLKIRLTPPSVLIGKHVLTKSEMDSFTTSFKTDYGNFRIDVAFSGDFNADVV